MKIIILILLVFVVASNNNNNKVDEIYEALYAIRESVDQTQLYEALEAFKKQYLFSSTQQEEAAKITNDFYATVKTTLDEKLALDKDYKERIEMLMKYGLLAERDSLQRTLNEKEKTSERDKKEAEKIFNLHAPTKSDLDKKIKELLLLINEMNKALDRGSNDDRFRLLEMIESKIAIGFFKIGKDTPPYAELQLFMKEVDHIFNDKDQNVYAKKIRMLISLVLSVTQDLLINASKQMEEVLVQESGQVEFFLKSIQAHGQEKEQHQKAIQVIQEKYIDPWEQFLDVINEHLDSTQDLTKVLEVQQEEDDKRSKRLLNLNSMKQMRLKHVLNDFFH